MVSEENRGGLYVTVPVYFLMLAGAAFWAYRRNENMNHKGTSDKLTAHYLAGRDFGPLLTAGTIFASLFSGYTVVGVPNEAYKNGWTSLRWMPTLMAIVMGYVGTGLRLRKTSIIRNHQSPVDFITDRFQSQMLRYTIVFLQVIPTVIYLAAQVVAIKGTFNSIFELDADATYPVVIIMTLILLFEWAGGLNSVALTDTIQAIIMVLSFIVLPSVIVKNWGGWSALDPESYPKPEFYQTPSTESQWGFWQFSLINFSFFTLPHLMQRTYAARDVQSLKVGYAVMTVGPWFTSFVGIFMGTVGVAMLANENGEAADPANPFSAILEEIMNLGGFAEAAGVIAITASLAAIMSTADSLIIAISQLITTEVIYPLRPEATPTEMAMAGKMASLFSVVLALVVGLFWDEGISDLGKIQFALSAQAVPAFLIGLYSYNCKTDAHPWCISIGALAACVYVVAFYFGYLKPNESPKAINAGVSGFFLQVVAIVVLESMRRLLGIGRSNAAAMSDEGDHYLDESTTGNNQNDTIDTPQLLYSGRPEWDVPKISRFGGNVALTPERVWESMEGVNEPLTNLSWTFLMIFVISMCTPLVAEMKPPMIISESGESIFAYAPAVFNGLPWWAFKTTLLCIVPTILLLVAIYNMPNQFPVDEEKIAKEGIDPDIVEMTQEEMGKRTSYDEPNILIKRRRNSISQTMEELGLQKKGGSSRRMMNGDFLEVAPLTPSQRKLTALAAKSSRSLNVSDRPISSMVIKETVDEESDTDSEGNSSG